jgi:hypothetical protein
VPVDLAFDPREHVIPEVIRHRAPILPPRRPPGRQKEVLSDQ